jgi:DNA-binding LacI/PurR family transcriptional regulator
MHPAAGLPVVSVDNYRGGRLATSHLVEQGYRRIGHVAGPLSWWEAEQRLAAWRDVLSEASLPVHGDMWVEGNWSSRSGELAAQQLLAQCPDLEAVFVANDQMALSMAHVAARQGRTIPGDLAVVGFDNLPESAYFHPPLTTVHQDLHRLGCRAVETVVGLIEAESALDRPPATSQAILIEPELIVRQSTLAPPS